MATNQNYMRRCVVKVLTMIWGLYYWNWQVWIAEVHGTRIR